MAQICELCPAGSVDEDCDMTIIGFILAAGRGTRLGELGQVTPKALIKVRGKELLAYSLGRMEQAGIEKVIVNVHHLADQVEQFLSEYQKRCDLEICISREEALLDTGGALLEAERFIDPADSVLLHNADILSAFSLNRLIAEHQDNKAVATLCCCTGDFDRALLFTDQNQLAGWRNRATSQQSVVERFGASELHGLGYCGVSLFEARIRKYFPKETKVFSLIDVFLRASQETAGVKPFLISDQTWLDVGTPQAIMDAELFAEKI